MSCDNTPQPSPRITKPVPGITKLLSAITELSPRITKLSSGITKPYSGITEPALRITKPYPGITERWLRITETLSGITKTFCGAAMRRGFVMPRVKGVPPSAISPGPHATIVLPSLNRPPIRVDGTGMRALSIRQPYAEQILRGIKTIEYRRRFALL